MYARARDNKTHDEGRLNHAILLAYIEVYSERRDGPDRVVSGENLYEIWG